jgi:hypothetical protein
MTRFAALLSTWLLGSPEPGRHHGIGQASEQIGIARHLIRHQFAEPGDLEPPDGGFVQVEGSVGAVRQFTPDK